jgi:hypothetical protein
MLTYTSTVSQDWEGKKQALDWDKMETALVDSAVPNVVFVDCTASSVVGEMYEGWLRSGYHVITPNKKAGSGTSAWMPQPQPIESECRPNRTLPDLCFKTEQHVADGGLHYSGQVGLLAKHTIQPTLVPPRQRGRTGFDKRPDSVLFAYQRAH